MSIAPVVVFDDVSFSWPDGQTVLSETAVALWGRTGLIGNNGAGKSTVLRLITGELKPTSGRVHVAGTVGVLPQVLTLQSERRVIDLLGFGEIFDALRAIEAGSVEQRLYDAVGQEWDVEARAAAALETAGLGGLGLERRVGELSGGEAMMLAVGGLFAARPDIALLDEPTNNLDASSRAAVLELICAWSGPAIVASHDRELLRRLDQVAEIDAGQLSLFGGFDSYCEQRAHEQAAATQAVVTARQQLRAQQRQRRDVETRLARSALKGRKDVANSTFIGAAADERRRRAEQSAGKARGVADDRLQAAADRLAEAEDRLRREPELSIVLPDPQIAATKRLLELGDGQNTVIVAGRQRVALTGRNGVGKTRLISGIFAQTDAGGLWARRRCERVGYLPQRLDDLVDDDTVLDNVRAAAPASTPGQIRGQLASFGLRGALVERPVRTLSGGERFSVCLARLLLADPPNQMVVLDEPTNNLDLFRVEELIAALRRYRGGLLVVSHDRRFLERIGIDTWLELSDEPDGPALRQVWT